MKPYFLLLIGLYSTAALAGDDFKEKAKNSQLLRFTPIKCEGTHYTWTGMLAEGSTEHTVEIKKSVNTSPLEFVILEKKQKLMVDNDEWKIIRSNAEETFAFYVDGTNIQTLVINYKYGKALYNKTFNNLAYGKQNAMAFVATCKNN